MRVTSPVAFAHHLHPSTMRLDSRLASTAAARAVRHSPSAAALLARTMGGGLAASLAVYAAVNTTDTARCVEVRSASPCRLARIRSKLVLSKLLVAAAAAATVAATAPIRVCACVCV